MGSASSKAARKFPTTAKPKVPPATSTAPLARPDVVRPLAETHKSQAIQEDARDPQLLANLSKLGPVRVDHHMQNYKTEATNTMRLFENRAKSEEEASSRQLSRNHLYSGTLTELLNARKGAKTRADIERLADKFNIDLAKLDALGGYVNSPSVDFAGIKRAAQRSTLNVVTEGAVEREEEVPTLPAVWIEPSLADAK